MVLFESTTFETYYRLRKTWKFKYYFSHFCRFSLISYIFAYLYIFRIFYCIFLSFTVYNIIKLYTADTDWRFNITSRCSLFCATAELKDIQFYEQYQEYVIFSTVFTRDGTDPTFSDPDRIRIQIFFGSHTLPDPQYKVIIIN